jgi:hypothetical protein
MKAKCQQYELEGWLVVSWVPAKTLEKKGQKPV